MDAPRRPIQLRITYDVDNGRATMPRVTLRAYPPRLTRWCHAGRRNEGPFPGRMVGAATGRMGSRPDRPRAGALPRPLGGSLWPATRTKPQMVACRAGWVWGRPVGRCHMMVASRKSLSKVVCDMDQGRRLRLQRVRFDHLDDCQSE